ncbi:MAG TPA: serine hydrolase domain-containing protein [Beijerinckiaceae bacterium]|nr:serine hydrolase domain-containing protein [Beijerinckiaceae bacterium]
MQKIDDILAAAVGAGDLPCIVAMVADRHGVVYAGAHGRQNMAEAGPARLDTTFRLHSMTKAITAVAALQLVERGLIDLDEPLGARFPALADKHILTGFAADGTPLTRKAQRPITLRHLLTHTAGFCYDMWNGDIARWQKATGTPGSRSGKLASLNQVLSFEPGTRWQYSIAIDHVGRIVEALTGTDLETCLRRSVLDPLGMTETTFRQSQTQAERRVAMHRRLADGGIEALPSPPEVPEYLNGGGALFGTVPDYLKFTRCLLAGGAPLVRPDSCAAMVSNQLGSLQIETLKAAIPALVADVEFWPGLAKGWGLSFLINLERTPEGRNAGSFGWAGLSNLYYWVDPAAGLTGVFASQMLPFFDRRAIDAFRAFERAVYEEFGKTA